LCFSLYSLYDGLWEAQTLIIWYVIDKGVQHAAAIIRYDIERADISSIFGATYASKLSITIDAVIPFKIRSWIFLCLTADKEVDIAFRKCLVDDRVDMRAHEVLDSCEGASRLCKMNTEGKLVLLDRLLLV
jgi:hypothetical protein